MAKCICGHGDTEHMKALKTALNRPCICCDSCLDYCQRREAIPGVKHDQDKDTIAFLVSHLFAQTGLVATWQAVHDVLAYGAAKYPSLANWVDVKPAERYLNAALRHIRGYQAGEWLDESGQPHLAHALTSLAMYTAHKLKEHKP